jgi:hypothetical protein
MSAVLAFDGTRVSLSEGRWKHIVLRYPELKNRRALVLNAVANPDELYIDKIGAMHSLKRFTNEVSNYLVVIYYRENEEGYKDGLLHKS